LIRKIDPAVTAISVENVKGLEKALLALRAAGR
jgi:hypothetical protein